MVLNRHEVFNRHVLSQNLSSGVLSQNLSSGVLSQKLSSGVLSQKSILGVLSQKSISGVLSQKSSYLQIVARFDPKPCPLYVTGPNSLRQNMETSWIMKTDKRIFCKSRTRCCIERNARVYHCLYSYCRSRLAADTQRSDLRLTVAV